MGERRRKKGGTKSSVDSIRAMIESPASGRK